MSTIASLVAVIAATKPSSEVEGYERIRARDAKVGDECFHRNLQWETIKNEHMLTGVEVQEPPCRRRIANIAAHPRAAQGET